MSEHVDYPKPNEEQRGNGWVIDPNFLKQVANRFESIDDDGTYIEMETIETVLLALNDVLWKVSP